MPRTVTPTEESFRLLFTANPLPMWLYDLETLAFLEVNDAAISHYGYSRDEFLRMCLTDIRTPEEAERLAGYLHDPTATLEYSIERRHLRRDGQSIDVEAALQRLEFQGRPAALVVVHDVTERNRAEEAVLRMNVELDERVRERTAELQTAVQELEAFSYSVSHDLRAPLRAIDGFSQALAEDVGPSLGPEATEHIRRIRAAAQRMAQLIDDLLGLSKVSRGDMRREVVDLSELTAKIVAERRRHDARPVTVTIAPEMKVVGDPQLLRVALENVIDNAWKFTSRREHAHVDIGDIAGDDGRRVFYVRDNGAGFDPTYADKLFAPFQRLHTPAEFPGTGIGLATVRRIVHRHGGRVWAVGQPDQGTGIYFTLA